MSSTYLNYTFTDTENVVSTFDELPLWSAAFGLFLLKHIEIKPSLTVVDIGCGTGFPLLELAGRLGSSSKLYGIDPWENAVKRAQLKITNYGYSNVELFATSAEQIPLNNNSVDLIVSNLGINNFDNPEKVFLECFRILKPGGRIALTTNLNGHWKLFYTIFKETLIQLNNEEYILIIEEEENHRSTIDSIHRQFNEAGLKPYRIFEETLEMNFADGSAFLNHHFIKLGWLTSWMKLFPKATRGNIFSTLETNLTTYAEKHDGLKLSVPMAYLEAVK